MLSSLELQTEKNFLNSVTLMKEDFCNEIKPIIFLGQKRSIFSINKEKTKSATEEKYDEISSKKKKNFFEEFSSIRKNSKSKGPFITNKKNEETKKKNKLSNQHRDNYIFLGKENFFEKNPKFSPKKEDTINSLSNQITKFDFLKNEIYDEDLESQRIKNIYSYMKKNFKNLPKTDINTKDLMNTYMILENINKLNKKKFDLTAKREEPFTENKNSNEMNYFNDFYNENEFEEKLDFECIFSNCGKTFATSDLWKKHYEMCQMG